MPTTLVSVFLPAESKLLMAFCLMMNISPLPLADRYGNFSWAKLLQYYPKFFETTFEVTSRHMDLSSGCGTKLNAWREKRMLSASEPTLISLSRMSMSCRVARAGVRLTQNVRFCDRLLITIAFVCQIGTGRF